MGFTYELVNINIELSTELPTFDPTTFDFYYCDYYYDYYYDFPLPIENNPFPMFILKFLFPASLGAAYGFIYGISYREGSYAFGSCKSIKAN